MKEPKPESLRGFARMNPVERQIVSSRGGIIAHQNGTAHKWTSEEAKAASMKRKNIRQNRASGC